MSASPEQIIAPIARRLTGRIALVTGAAGEIGRAVVARLAAEGATVVATDLAGAATALQASADAGRQDADGEVHTRHLDVTDPAAVAAVVAEVTATIGPPDAVVTSAGYQGAFAPLADYPLDDLRTVLDVNVVGTFAVMQACAGALLAAGKPGAIVALASMAGVSGARNMPAYAASKAATHGLVRAAAKDLASHGIRVNSVSPGFIGPGTMWDRQVQLQASNPGPYQGHTPEEVAAMMIAQVPLDRYGSVAEVAAVIAFLLSDDSSFLTGTDTEVSGGSA